MISDAYRAQVDLLLQVLPHVAKEECFALKGGTAINLFVRDMPRLSVDIDLTYLPLDDRTAALAGITEALRRTKARIETAIPGCRVAMVPQTDGQEAKLTCQTQAAQIKVEVNTTMRGHVLPPRMMDVADTVEDQFGRFMSVNVVSHAELFGGKICAALDRQHPRDLFDVHHMLESEGYTDEIRLGFITALLSHGRPMHEVIRPNFQDQARVFETQFAGMAFTAFSYADYEATRDRLVTSMAVKALNISDFRPDDEMHIEQMLEPIVMGVVYPDAADAFARWIVKEDRANPEAMIKKLWSRVDGLHHLNI